MAKTKPGADLASAQDREPYERTIDVAGKPITVTVQSDADGGFSVIVPIRGETTSVYGDTEAIALDAARERLIAAANGMAERRVKMEYELSLDVAGATYEVTQRDFVDGGFDLRVGAFPQLVFTGTDADDQDAALETLRDQLADLLGAQTVDGEPAKIVRNGRSYQQPLIEPDLDAEALLREIARADDELLEAIEERKPFDEAVKAAKERREAIVTQLVAAGHRVRSPQLPLGVA